MADDKKLPEEVEELLNDDQIREYFQSRDPNRPKINPFLDSDVEESVRGKASALTVKDEEESDEKVYGISYSQHTKHIRDVARHFFFIGSAVALAVAILLAVIL